VFEQLLQEFAALFLMLAIEWTTVTILQDSTTSLREQERRRGDKSVASIGKALEDATKICA